MDSQIRTPSFKDLVRHQNARALPRTYVSLSFFRPTAKDRKKERKQQSNTGRLDPTRRSANSHRAAQVKEQSENERKKENLEAPARSTNDERTDASTKNTALTRHSRRNPAQTP
jgi:hypothetical protein